MEEKTLTLKDLGNYAENLFDLVLEQHDRLEKRLDVQDDQYKKLWDAYRSMGISSPDYAQRLTDPVRIKILETKDEAYYWDKYNQTNGELDRLLGLLKDHDNQLEVLKKTEQVIVDLVILLNFQWEGLLERLGNIRKQVKVSRDAERTNLANYRAIEHTLTDHLSGESVKKAFAFEQEQLILQQIDLFESEQGVLTQMEFVCDERDRVFPIATQLFLK